MKRADSRLQPWLELASLLEEFDSFMRAIGLPQQYDAGVAAARRMHKIAENKWTWFGWKRDGLRGVVAMEIRTFRRWIAEGFFYGCSEEQQQEILHRIGELEARLKQLCSK